MNNQELDQLRSELLRRLDERPFKTWSPSLIRAVIAVLDLTSVTPPPVQPPVSVPQLRLV